MRTPYATKSGVQIGIRAPFTMPIIQGHALMLQSALLDKRTATPLSSLQRFFGAIWRWL